MSAQPKLSRLRAAYAAGDRIEALRIAARFPSLGAERGPILTAWGAIQNRAMYLQMGKQPDALIAQGVAAMAAKYGL